MTNRGKIEKTEKTDNTTVLPFRRIVRCKRPRCAMGMYFFSNLDLSCVNESYHIQLYNWYSLTIFPASQCATS
jgi:hypothetical protein